MRNIHEASRLAPRRTTPGRLGVAGIAALLLAACAPMPSGPSVAVMPSPNKPFEVFMQEDQLCRGWAAHSIGQAGNDAAADAMLRSTVTGAAVGAIAGAMVGGDRNIGSGATAGSAQRRYDIAYQQCMYSKGNQLPSYDYGSRRYPPPPPASPAPR